MRCEICGKPLPMPYSSRRRYCSNACKQKAYRRRRQRRRVRARMHTDQQAAGHDQPSPTGSRDHLDVKGSDVGPQVTRTGHGTQHGKTPAAKREGQRMSEVATKTPQERLFIYKRTTEPAAYCVGYWTEPEANRFMTGNPVFITVAGPFSDFSTGSTALTRLQNRLTDASPTAVKVLGAQITSALLPGGGAAVRQKGGDVRPNPDQTELIRGVHMRRRLIRCGKQGCTRCPHGPYSYVVIRGYGRKRRELSLGRNPTKRDFYQKLGGILTALEIKRCIRAWATWKEALNHDPDSQPTA